MPGNPIEPKSSSARNSGWPSSVFWCARCRAGVRARRTRVPRLGPDRRWGSTRSRQSSAGEQNAARRVARVARRVLVELLRVEQRAAAARERVRLAAALGVVGVEPRCQPPQHAAGEGDEEALGVREWAGQAGQQALHHVARNELRIGGVPKRAGRTPEGAVRRRARGCAARKQCRARTPRARRRARGT